MKGSRQSELEGVGWVGKVNLKWEGYRHGGSTRCRGGAGKGKGVGG